MNVTLGELNISIKTTENRFIIFDRCNSKTVRIRLKYKNYASFITTKNINVYSKTCANISVGV